MPSLELDGCKQAQCRVSALAIADGLRPHGEVRTVAVGRSTADLVAWADLVIVGGPTHAHGMTRASTRNGAREAAAKPASELTLDPDSEGLGLRERFGSLGDGHGKRAAAFNSQFDGPALLTGRASVGIASQLRRHGFTLVAEPTSFLVDRRTSLAAGESERAVRWGADPRRRSRLRGLICDSEMTVPRQRFRGPHR